MTLLFLLTWWRVVTLQIPLSFPLSLKYPKKSCNLSAAAAAADPANYHPTTHIPLISCNLLQVPETRLGTKIISPCGQGNERQFGLHPIQSEWWIWGIWWSLEDLPTQQTLEISSASKSGLDMYLWTILRGKKINFNSSSSSSSRCDKFVQQNPELGKIQHNLSGEFEEDDPTNSWNLISGKTCKTCIGSISGPFCSKTNNNNRSSSNNKFVQHNSELGKRSNVGVGEKELASRMRLKKGVVGELKEVWVCREKKLLAMQRLWNKREGRGEEERRVKGGGTLAL